MKEFWNSRYSSDEYAYGNEPNEFFKEELLKLKPKTILFPAEGEGRNAVYAAEKGWKVSAFDFSESAKVKALKLAQSRNVEIQYETCSFKEFKALPNSFDCITLIYVHIPPNIRTTVHKSFVNMLKSGGTIILEAFSKEQISNKSGGPANIELLYSNEDLKKDFKDLKELKINNTETVLSEGNFHKGTASVIRLIGTK